MHPKEANSYACKLVPSINLCQKVQGSIDTHTCKYGFYRYKRPLGINPEDKHPSWEDRQQRASVQTLMLNHWRGSPQRTILLILGKQHYDNCIMLMKMSAEEKVCECSAIKSRVLKCRKWNVLGRERRRGKNKHCDSVDSTPKNIPPDVTTLTNRPQMSPRFPRECHLWSTVSCWDERGADTWHLLKTNMNSVRSVRTVRCFSAPLSVGLEHCETMCRL